MCKGHPTLSTRVGELLAASAGSKATSTFTCTLCQGWVRLRVKPRSCDRAAAHVVTEFCAQSKQRPNRRLQPTAAGAIMSRRG